MSVKEEFDCCDTYSHRKVVSSWRARVALAKRE